MVEAGFAVVDITPPAGLAMSGFGARTEPALGAHDALTARALVVGDTAVLAIDVIGVTAEISQRIRARCVLPEDNVIVAATHTHGGPVSMPGRLGAGDAAWLTALEEGCVTAIDRAAANRQPASLSFGVAANPGFARNRRHVDGPVDGAVPVLRVRDANGVLMGVVVSYACHPVVLGADNRLWTADYPHFARVALEAANPGATAIFLTGCCGDVNTGHSAHASITLAANADRTFERAERLGLQLADCVQRAPEAALGDAVTAKRGTTRLDFEALDLTHMPELAAVWRSERASAEPARAALLDLWIAWAEGIALRPQADIEEAVSLIGWGGLKIAAMPGEIFAQTALDLRADLGPDLFVLAFCDDNPGYIPPAAEYPFGGYEVEEAYRAYGLPAGFAPGAAERLADAVRALDKAGHALEART